MGGQRAWSLTKPLPGPAAARRGGPLGRAAARRPLTPSCTRGSSAGPGPGAAGGLAGRRGSLRFAPELKEPVRLEGGGGC